MNQPFIYVLLVETSINVEQFTASGRGKECGGCKVERCVK